MLFSSLTYAPPDDPIEGALWIGCLTEADSQTGCAFDESAFNDLKSLDKNSSPAEIEEAFQRLNEAGFLGLEPDWPPMWIIPDDALEGVEDRLEGVSAFVNISLLPKDASALGDDDPDLEAGFKRIAVSEATSPNHNPDIKDIVVAGTPIGDAKGFTARTGRTYILDPILEDGHIETYSYITSSGEEEQREEEPYFTWYTELGTDNKSKQARFDTDYSLYPYSSVEWTAPEVAGTIRIHVVTRDRRGGMGWRSLLVNVL